MLRLLPALLFIAACTARPEVTAVPSKPPVPLPAPPVQPTPPAPESRVAEPAEATSLRGFADAEGVQVELQVDLPPLPPRARARLTRAVAGGLLAGLELPRGEIQGQAEALRDRLVRDRAAAGGTGTWRVARRAGTVWQGPALLCLSLGIEEESGAGGNAAASVPLVIDVSTLRALTLDELVPPPAQPALQDLLVRRIREQRRMPAEAPLSAQGLLVDRPAMPMPFVDAAGLRFVWNAGELAPRDQGPLAVTLTRLEAAAYLAVDPWPSGR